ncbi:MAG TPA: hypothetical protein VL128_10980 [Candidatus Eisenbacteria bacterium]|nr:hypothetical protein [Candidatus Eisenbacteria bacterium]
MKLSGKSMAFAGTVLWGGAILFVGLINLALPTFGLRFLEMIGSVYPFFHASRSIGDVLIGTADGLIDGAIAGFLFAWLYNLREQTARTS